MSHVGRPGGESRSAQQAGRLVSRAWRHGGAGRGFTLIELMIALAMSLLISAGLAMVYVNTKTSFRTQDRLSQLADNERMALIALGHAAAAAGYFPDPSPSRSRKTVFPAVAVSGRQPAMAAGQAVGGSGAASGIYDASDSLSLRFLTANGDGIANCVGATNTSGAERLSTNTFYVNSNKELVCSVDGGTPEVLATDVHTFWVRYGVDTDDNGSADTYLNAAQLAATAHATRVRSLRITLRFLDRVNAAPGSTTPLPSQVDQVVALPNLVQ